MQSKKDNETLEIISTILEDYEDETRFINEYQLWEQPDTVVVADILNKLIKVVFPGFFRVQDYQFFNLESQLHVLIEDVVHRLNDQIIIALKHNRIYADRPRAELAAIAKRIVQSFLRKIPKIRAYLETDVEAAYDGDPAAYDKYEIVLSYPGFYALTVHRIAHELYLLEVPLIPRIMAEYAHARTGIDIHPGVTIGKYFFIDHGTGIVIGETAVIGDRVKIYQSVTIGALSTRGGQGLKGVKRHPTIEDDVTIYSGASILGGETVVGKGAVIGGNAFITTSIEPGARVSIKNQELNIKQGEAKELYCADVPLAESWYYMI